MKVFTYVLLVVALGLIIFNITQIDFSNLMSSDSVIAMIGVVAALCAVLILLIFRMSKTIQDKLKD